MTLSTSIRRLITSEDKFIFVATTIIFIITLTFGDRISFAPAGDYWNRPLYYIVKLAVLVLIYLALQLLVRMLKGLLNHDEVWKLRIRYGSVLGIIAAIVWLTLFPGVIMVDEANVLHAAINLDIQASWHHVLTSVWYASSLSIYPALATITLLQALAMITVIAYGATVFHMRFGGKYGLLFMLYFLLPTSLVAMVSPHRIFLCTTLEVGLLLALMTYYYSKRSATPSQLLIWGAVTGLIGSWRAENVVYAVGVPVFVYLIQRSRTKVGSFRAISMLSGTMFVVMCSVFALQGLNHDLQRQYQVTGLMSPLASVLKGGNYNGANMVDVREAVNKAIDYDSLVEGKDVNMLYWSRRDRTISSGDLDRLKKVTLQLIARNPISYTQGTFRVLMESGLLRDDRPLIYAQPDLRFANHLLGARVLNAKVWLYSFRTILGYNPISGQVTLVRRIMYATPAAVVGILALLLSAAVQRSSLSILLLAVLCKSLIVILVAPMPSTSYYYPIVATFGVFFIPVICTTRRAEKYSVTLR